MKSGDIGTDLRPKIAKQPPRSAAPQLGPDGREEKEFPLSGQTHRSRSHRASAGASASRRDAHLHEAAAFVSVHGLAAEAELWR